MRDIAGRADPAGRGRDAGAVAVRRSLLFGYVGAFMYEGDAPLAERRAQALALDSALLAELLGQAELRELLDPAGGRRDRAGAAAAGAGPRLPGRRGRRRHAARARAADRRRRSAQRSADPAQAPSWLAEPGRAAPRARAAHRRRAAVGRDRGRRPAARRARRRPAARRAGRLHRASRRSAARPGAAVRAHARAVRRGRRRASATGSASPSSPARCTGWRPRASSAEGEFRPGGRASSGATPGCCACCGAGAWRSCARRSSRRRRRAFAAFLPAWQHARPRRQPGSRRQPAAAAAIDAVYDVIDQLAGSRDPGVGAGDAGAARPGARLLAGLAGRADARPARCSGRARARCRAATAGSRWRLPTAAPLLLPEPAEITMTPVHEAVLSALDGGGALFFRAIADRVAAAWPSVGPGLAATDREVAARSGTWSGPGGSPTTRSRRCARVLGSGRPVAPAPTGSQSRAPRPAGRRPSPGGRASAAAPCRRAPARRP